jgi:hypothetical protein
MSYELNFTDPSKTTTIKVPEYPPGVNAIDTSLTFVGRAYPNYGRTVNENLLKILENFASPASPANPIEGQLWYDSGSTSLKVYDGTTWSSANRLYQQGTNPQTNIPSPSIANGDIWVDTANNVLKIYGSGNWIQVGPSISTGTGISVEVFNDAFTATTHNVLLNWVDNEVVATLSLSTFTPETYPSGMQGFTELVKGITLADGYVLRGIAEDANKLGSVEAESYLRKDDSSVIGQIISGKIVYETPSFTGAEGRDGVIIRIAGDSPFDYTQYYKLGNNAIISNNTPGGQIILRTRGLIDSAQVNTLVVDRNELRMNGSIVATSINGLSSTGTLQVWAGSTSTALPTGWLLCNGSQVSSSTYASLYSVLGNIYGPASGGQFYLPNLYTTVNLPIGSPTPTTNVYYIIKT